MHCKINCTSNCWSIIDTYYLKSFFSNTKVSTLSAGHISDSACIYLDLNIISIDIHNLVQTNMMPDYILNGYYAMLTNNTKWDYISLAVTYTKIDICAIHTIIWICTTGNVYLHTDVATLSAICIRNNCWCHSHSVFGIPLIQTVVVVKTFPACTAHAQTAILFIW